MRERGATLLPLALLLLLSVSCATRSYRYQELDNVDFRSRAETQRQGRVQVTAAVPSAEEAQAILGVPVYQRGIQPIWLEVEKRTRLRLPGLQTARLWSTRQRETSCRWRSLRM